MQEATFDQLPPDRIGILHRPRIGDEGVGGGDWLDVVLRVLNLGPFKV